MTYSQKYIIDEMESGRRLRDRDWDKLNPGTTRSRKRRTTRRKSSGSVAVCRLAFGMSFLLMSLYAISRFFLERVGSGDQLGVKLSVSLRKPSASFNDNRAASNSRNLIMVACHGIAKRGFVPSVQPRDVSHLSRSESVAMDEGWHLLDYQKNSGIAAGILLHIEAGIKRAEKVS